MSWTSVIYSLGAASGEQLRRIMQPALDKRAREALWQLLHFAGDIDCASNKFV